MPYFDTKPAVLMFLTMEVVVSVNHLTVIQTSVLKAIPSHALVIQAISILCKHQSRDNNVYINFHLDLWTMMD
jgi:hypothetical protein